MNRGYLFHFDGISQKTVEGFKKALLNRQLGKGFTVSCVDTACSVLRKGTGIQINGESGKNIFLNSTFKKMLENGFVDAQDQPAKVTLFRTDSEVPSLDRSLKIFQTKDAIMSGVYPLAVGSTVYFIFEGAVFVGKKRVLEVL